MKFKQMKALAKKLIDLGEYEISMQVIEQLPIMEKYADEHHNEVLGASAAIVDIAIEIVNKEKDK
jgi:hypothetical protein